MKRAKKIIPKVKKEVILKYEIQCPHCHTFLQGGFNTNTIVYKCSNCENPITIEWDKAINVSNF
jgi:hypothetical protein